MLEKSCQILFSHNNCIVVEECNEMSTKPAGYNVVETSFPKEVCELPRRQQRQLRSKVLSSLTRH